MRSAAASFALGLLLFALPAAAQRETPVPKELLERVAAWAEKFVSEFQNYAGEETLTEVQWDRKGRIEAQRRITSDYVVLRLPATAGGEPRDLVELRDVIVVDGREIKNLAKRSEKWLKLSSGRTKQEIGALFEEPSEHRLSREHFTGLILLVTRLGARHQDKMKYFFAPDTSDPPSENVLVGYRQVSGEGLIEVDGRPIYPSGQAWVDPDEGHVVRIEEEFQHKNTRYFTAVEFSRDEALDAWLPHQITVRIFEKGRLALENVYSYTGFRRLGR